MPTYTVGGEPITYRRPSTTRDVLEYRVWILCIDDETESIAAMIEWAAKWATSHTSAELLDLLTDINTDEEPALIELAKLCEAIASSAELPPDVLSGMRTLLDKQNGIDPKWKPKSPCPCLKCRRDADENPPGVECIYGNAGLVVVSVVAYSSGLAEGSLDDPYYVTQIRGVQQAASNRVMAHHREEREEQARWKEFRRQHGANVH